MYLSIITDCYDEGTMNRQVVRASVLFPDANISHVGVGNYADTEASGIIIDTLDASLDKEGIIIANVAPRHGKAKKWPNGTPFGHIKTAKTDIFATVDGLTLSLINKLGIAKNIEVYDIPTVIDSMIEKGLFPNDNRDYVINTQFRSYEFLPRVAKWYHDGVDLPYELQSLSDFLQSPLSIWFVDNFGNCKTTALASDIDHKPEKMVKTKFGNIMCYANLKDVPSGEAGLTIGSSGYHDDRFIELVVQGKSASKRFGANVGDLLV